MKLKTILSAATALCAVGTFYTFAFCMVDGIDETEIPREYYYDTATDTAPVDMETANTVKAEISMYSPVINKYNKENADVPERVDENLSGQVESAPDYMAANENGGAEPVNTVPLYSSPAEAAVTTVPEDLYETAASTEAYTEAQPVSPGEIAISEANADSNYSDLINSENYLDREPAYTENGLIDDGEDYTDTVAASYPSLDEIMRNLQDMQEEADASTPPLWGGYDNTDATVIYSETYFFDTTPTVIEITTAAEETTTTTAETTETTTALASTAADGTEMVTARFDGRVQEVSAYDLVCMIVSTEMSPNFSQEALKAQAVAAYSYVKYHNYKGLVPSVLVKRDIPDEVRAAVDAVFGQCCYYNGAPAQTVYTASTAGTTASCTNVWGGNDVPYLRSIDTSFDAQYDPNYGVTQTFTEDYVRRALENYCGITLSDDPNSWFSIQSRIDGNYVGNVLIDGQTTVTGRTVREKIMGFKIKSACFDVSYSDGTFYFVTYGYGHGVGMSQNGANILGKQGWTYDQILQFYFPGITIS